MRRRDVELPSTPLSLVIALSQFLSPLRLGVFLRIDKLAILLAAVALVGEVVASGYVPHLFTQVANKPSGEANPKNSTKFAIQTAAKSPIPAVASVFQATTQEIAPAANGSTSDDMAAFKVVFNEDCRENPLKRFSIKGPVQWKEGTIQLGASEKGGAPTPQLERQVGAGPVTELSVDWQFESLRKSGETSDAVLGMTVAGKSIELHIRREMKGNGETCTVALVHQDLAAKQLYSRETELADAKPKGVWTLGYCWGVYFAEHDGQRILISCTDPRTLYTLKGFTPTVVHVRHTGPETAIQQVRVAANRPLPLRSRTFNLRVQELNEQLQKLPFTMSRKLALERRRLVGEILELYRSANAVNDPQYFGYLHEFATASLRCEEPMAAAQASQETLQLCRKYLGDDHGFTLETLQLCADLASTMSDYRTSLDCMHRYCDGISQLIGKENRYYAFGLMKISACRQLEGDLNQAIVWRRESIEILKRLSKKPPQESLVSPVSILSNLSALALLQRTNGDLAGNESTIGEIKQLIESLATSPYQKAVAQISGHTLLGCGEYAAARPLLGSEIDRLHKLSARPAMETHNLAGLHLSMGDSWLGSNELNNAMVEYDQARKLFRNPDLQSSWRNHNSVFMRIGNLHRLQGNPQRALETYEEVLGLELQSLQSWVNAQSEIQQLASVRSMRSSLDFYLSTAQSNKVDAEKAYQHCLALKGLVFAVQQRIRLQRSNPELAPLFLDLQEVAWELPELNTHPMPTGGGHDLQRLLERQQTVEQQLALRSTDFRRDKDEERASPKTISQGMPPGAALVDFYVYGVHDAFRSLHDAIDDLHKDNETKEVIAFVTRPGRPLQLVKLGAMKPIEEAIDAWRESIQNAKAANERELAARVYQMVWAPFQKHVADSKMILVCPEGSIAKIPFSALPGRQANRFLLEDHALVIAPVPNRLVSMRQEFAKDGANTGAAKAANEKMLAIGDVDFMKGSQSSSPTVSNSKAIGLVVHRGEPNFSALPGTAREVADIESLFSATFPKATVLTLRRDEATESRFRQKVSDASYLHLATHAFFNPRKAKTAASPSLDIPATFGADQMPMMEHPGLLSGLVFAGANRKRSLEDFAGALHDDGVLTALEASSLDMDRIKLAVLSACETGIGEDSQTVGVIGLQRAFQLAGARTTIASLWKVDDRATQALMTEFYRNLWTKKLSTIESLRRAQLTMIERYAPEAGVLRGAGEVTKTSSQRLVDAKKANRSNAQASPAYWAAFQLAGEW